MLWRASCKRAHLVKFEENCIRSADHPVHSRVPSLLQSILHMHLNPNSRFLPLSQRSFVCGLLDPQHQLRSLTLPIPPGTTLKGGLTVPCSPSEIKVNTTAHKVTPLHAPAPLFVKFGPKHSYKTIWTVNAYATDQSSTNSAGLSHSMLLSRPIRLWGALLPGSDCFDGCLLHQRERWD